jgi:SpoVK/Ycf46/Vps4 family AAA+-type ATPase
LECVQVSAPEIVSGMSGESEAKIRGLFDDAVVSKRSLSIARPNLILFI